MFFERSASRFVTSTSLSASSVIEVSGDVVDVVVVERAVLERVRRVAGLVEVAVGERVGVDDQRPALRQVARFVFSAAGFIATSTFGRVARREDVVVGEVDLEARRRPAATPAGARISAGKSGSVERSLPRMAVSLVNRPPVSCIPSPESPANRMTTSDPSV